MVSTAGSTGNTADSACEEGLHLLIVSLVRLFRDGLTFMLEQRPGVRSVCAVESADAAISALERARPTLVLLDVASEDGLLAGRRIADAAPWLPILGFAARAQDHDVVAYARAGISGFVPCDASVTDLFDAIERAGKGELLCSPRAAGTLFRQLAALTGEPRSELQRDQLTSREREIVSLIDVGLSNKEISRRLRIEVSTVKNHVHNIIEKLRVTRRGEAAARMRVVDARRKGSMIQGFTSI